MKKVKKVLVDGKLPGVGLPQAGGDSVAPAWFVPTVEKVVKQLLAEAVAPLATKVELAEAVAQLARKDEMASSFRTIIDMLDECATKDDFKKLETRTHKTMMTISDHETRIIHLEGHFPPVTLGNSRR